MIKTVELTSTVTEGSGDASANKNGEVIKPIKKASRQPLSELLGFNALPKMPLMPAIFPLNKSSIDAAMPIITPPASALHGVKLFQAIDIF
tara:strand:- start:94743 stop:95015 length:273 start_codon:yes stop_codon:yes gene_type:complete